MQLILASNSPRRKELLEQGGYKFTITVSDFDENSIEKEIIGCDENNYFNARKKCISQLNKD